MQRWHWACCHAQPKYVFFSFFLSLAVAQHSFVQIILAQVDRDTAVLELLKKLGEVYNFVAQNEKLRQIESMSAILAKISQQTRECAHFIKNYSETKNFCECYRMLCCVLSQASTIITGKRLGKNIVSETSDTIQKYCDVFNRLMENFRDQVTHDVAIHIHRTGEGSDVFVT
jgi:hypothetical protein